ncbi:MAG: hypothetical protein ACMXYD_03515 [Candidatus Woesearchaeota archaeon]
MQQRERSNFSYERLSLLNIETTVNIQQPQIPFFAIDNNKTYNHDDALGIQRLNADWYKLSIAISGISNHTEFITKKLPYTHKNSFSGTKKQYSLNGERKEVFLIQYFTDGYNIEQPSVSHGFINSTAVTPTTTPRWFSEELIRSTRAKHEEDAVNRAMNVFNCLFANYARQKGIYLPFKISEGEIIKYQAEPGRYEYLGVPAYVKASSPLINSLDRFALLQGFESLKKKGSLRSRKTVEKLCEYENKKLHKAA